MNKSKKELRDVIRSKTNWNKVYKVMLREALGGYEYVNGNGIKVIAKPDSVILTLFLQYGLGKPDVLTNQSSDNQSEQQKIVEANKLYGPVLLPKEQKSGAIAPSATTASVN